MSRTFLESAKSRIFTWLSGIIFSLVGLPGLLEDLQTWAKWIKGFDFRMSLILVIFGLLLLGVSVYSEIRLRRERSRQKVAEKRGTVSLKEAINFIASSKKWKHDRTDDEILEWICQQAIDSRITVTGYSHNQRYHEPISQERSNVPPDFLCQSVLVYDDKEERPVLRWQLGRWGKAYATGKSAGANTFFLSAQSYYDPEVSFDLIEKLFDDR